MEEKQTHKLFDTRAVSPLAKDDTFGERTYHFIFDKLLNFWVNLLSSAGFSLFAASSTSRFRLWGMRESATPRDMQQGVANFVSRLLSPFMSDPDARMKRAFAVTEVNTLLIPGHLIMIPSVWLGAKIKPAFVRMIDRWHYGKNAEADPTIAYRHALIDAEAKPTLLGAVVGRIGTALTTLTTSAIIGSEKNFLNQLGDRNHFINRNIIGRDIDLLRNFPGINPVAARIGEVIGGGMVQELSFLDRFNQSLSRHFTWSNKQIDRDMHLDATGAPRPYNNAVADYVGFTAMDTLYTAITASVIHPIMALLRKVPGMTYTTHPPVEKQLTHESGQVTKLRVPRNRMGLAINDNALKAANDDKTIPKPLVSAVARGERLAAAPVRELEN